MNYPLIVIAIAELFGGSLWFSANGAADGLMLEWGISTPQLGYLTSAVQVGFITGTFLFAVTGLADRYCASRIFVICALLGAGTNFIFAMINGDFASALVLRFVTGIALAGIYPIGMKMVVTWAPDKKALALGWLVGMLTLGTALPHLVRAISLNSHWQIVIYSASVLALIAAFMIYRLGDGPNAQVHQSARWGGVLKAFKERNFRGSVFGYFGHMWKLYAFWTIVPLLAMTVFSDSGNDYSSNISFLAFLIIGIGALGCIVGGYFSHRFGSAKVAAFALTCSASMCLCFPFLLSLPSALLVILLLFWGVMVVADSPQFSALAAQTCPPAYIGSAFAIMNSIGFLLTVFAIELCASQWQLLGANVTWLLLPGPLAGLWGMYWLLFRKSKVGH